MMDKEFLDRILDQALEEASEMYVKNEELENTKIEDEDVEFSDLHKEKMKRLFKEVRKEDNRRKAVRLTKRVAIIVLCTLLITFGLITSVEAWRKEVIKFIMKNNDDNYMSINFGGTDTENDIESGVENVNQFEIDDIKFLYLPKGFEFVEEKTSSQSKNFYFKSNNNYILLKKEILEDRFEKELDIENALSKKIKFQDKEVFRIIKGDNRVDYIWYDEYHLYEVLSNINEEEILKYIENIKILKVF